MQSSQQLTHSRVSPMIQLFDVVVQTTQQITLMYYLAEKAFNWRMAMPTQLVSSWQTWFNYHGFVQFWSAWKRRRILKKGDSYAIYREKTINSYCYFQLNHFALVDYCCSSFHSTGFWRGHSNHNLMQLLFPPQWFLKCQPWKTSNNSWCRTLPLQWMWDSVFISW